VFYDLFLIYFGCGIAECEVSAVTSSTNGRDYCVVSHSAILHSRAKNPLVADQIAINHRLANFLSMRPNEEFFLMGREARKKGQ
jgi:AhpD family alkylhydroperoxidase